MADRHLSPLLDVGEAEALRTIVAIAAHDSDDDEVSGFAYDLNPNDLSLKAGFGSLGLKVGPPTRFASDGGLGGTRIVNMGDDEGGVI